MEMPPLVFVSDETSIPSRFDVPYRKVKAYVDSFLTAKHPFRKGAICPFVPLAVNHRTINYAVLGDIEVGESVEKVSRLLDAFIDFRARVVHSYSALMIIFEECFPIEKLIAIQHLCKPICIEKHVMIGATYPANRSPSLHNPNYFPLRTPMPCLVMRDLSASDLVFLDPAQYEIPQRVSFLRVFISRFERSPSPFDAVQVAKAREILNGYIEVGGC